jgi:hypothetical protein
LVLVVFPLNVPHVVAIVVVVMVVVVVVVVVVDMLHLDVH